MPRSGCPGARRFAVPGAVIGLHVLHRSGEGQNGVEKCRFL